ncbi:hypothetical protein E2C01_054564 [Portunus trituberculatus]|uniref:Uncharacterized protein n=1 Tax=Portunus trituberculatus TaxID=210409 RepID=A0A5B7GTJ8_PORTR|nr:hypothetical protein [Portunus trituberculatus]
MPSLFFNLPNTPSLIENVKIFHTQLPSRLLAPNKKHLQ